MEGDEGGRLLDWVATKNLQITPSNRQYQHQNNYNSSTFTACWKLSISTLLFSIIHTVHWLCTQDMEKSFFCCGQYRFWLQQYWGHKESIVNYSWSVFTQKSLLVQTWRHIHTCPFKGNEEVSSAQGMFYFFILEATTTVLDHGWEKKQKHCEVL